MRRAGDPYAARRLLCGREGGGAGGFMALCEIRWPSRVLQKKLATYVVVPDPGVGESPYPVYYLLHGLSDDYSAWVRRSRVEWYARELPLIIVMPDGFRGFFTNNHAGPAYATYMAEELVDLVERNFP